MYNYQSIIKNLFLIVFIVQIIKLYNEKNELSSINKKLLKKQKRQSELIVKNKLKEIDSLKQQIERDEYLIDEALNIIADLQNEKSKIEKVYIDNVKEINTFDANELKNYFKDEIK